LTTKIHLLCNQIGEPLRFLLTGGQVHDCTQAVALLSGRKAEAVLADKGYDAYAIVEHIEARGAKAVIPPKSNRKQQREYDRELYKKRNPNSSAGLPTGTTRTESASKPLSRSPAPSILLLSIVDTA